MNTDQPEPRNSTFEKVLSHLTYRTCPTSDQVSVLIAPPLTEKRIAAYRKSQTFPRKYFSRRKEFVQANSNHYMATVVLPIVREAEHLRKEAPATKIIPDASFRDFRREVNNVHCRVLFLVAHHIPDVRRIRRAGGADYPGGIEFAEGGWPWAAVEHTLSSARRSEPLAFVLLSCEAGAPARRIYTQNGHLGEIAYAMWPLPAEETVRFARMWIRQLDGKRTLRDAYECAIRDSTQIHA